MTEMLQRQQATTLGYAAEAAGLLLYALDTDALLQTGFAFMLAIA